MPLLPPGDLFSPESILSQIPTSTSPESPHFLIFFAEWCPDCTEVQSSLDQHVPDKNSTLVLVGDRTQWKESKFREPPFNVTRIPTLIRVEQGGDALASSLDSAPRLVESELRSPEQLSQFVA
ncbi:thioredoxin-like protein 5 [Rhodotorula diobovata]|uniref:Thioredoxin-like protein 5 n=1 Tax=Rhodotorula diobovata TaxID=5288 RepID=A0A5C5G2Z1_9BASI|nr:thioredoxin-like protein 5 [Rhodotorula diobovata]